MLVVFLAASVLLLGTLALSTLVAWRTPITFFAKWIQVEQRVVRNIRQSIPDVRRIPPHPDRVAGGEATPLGLEVPRAVVVEIGLRVVIAPGEQEGIADNGRAANRHIVRFEDRGCAVVGVLIALHDRSGRVRHDHRAVQVVTVVPEVLVLTLRWRVMEPHTDHMINVVHATQMYIAQQGTTDIPDLASKSGPPPALLDYSQDQRH